MNHKKRIAIIGAGPAGLTAAYLLGKTNNFHIDVFEKDPTYVGGISRTESYKGYHFDIGGHRFFSKSQEVEDFWTEILGDEMLERPRSSRIFYNNTFFAYPLVAGEALRKLGIVESALCVTSYFKARLFPVKNPKNFEDWVSNEFGSRLFRIFFKTYTEKVWGVPCTELSADWAAQRIKGLSLMSAIKNALFPPSKKNGKSGQIKTLIDSFRYPKNGPGQMWEACADMCRNMGVNIHMGVNVSGLEYVSENNWNVNTNSGIDTTHYDYVISTAPVRELINAIKNPVPKATIEAANALNYRDFLTVVVILKDKNVFSDNWIYIHDPEVKVGRIQHFKSWSPYMIPNADNVCYGLEYFCFEGDGLWTSSNEALGELGKKELEKIGLAKAEEVEDTYVVRQPKAYPVYDAHYARHLETIKNTLQKMPGLILIGRNGMHKYNNQDHSMMTAMLAVKNIIAGKEVYNLWNVNEDAEYHESGERGSEPAGRSMPKAINA